MANKQNDEYEFVDYDNVGADPLGKDEGTSTKNYVTTQSSTNPTLRNALIVLVLIGLGLAIYKFMIPFFVKHDSSIISNNSSATDNLSSASTSSSISGITNSQTLPDQGSTEVNDNNLGVDETTSSQTSQVQPLTTSATITTHDKTATTIENAVGSEEVLKKLASLEINQQSLSNEVTSLTSRLTSISDNMSNLTVKISDLNHTMLEISAKIEQKANQLTQCKPAVKKSPTRMIRRVSVQRPLYSIQAVIPGRAWLIASNGSTLTVREGSDLKGYGVVKLIDPQQGVVFTSSGQTIRFSQQDS